MGLWGLSHGHMVGLCTLPRGSEHPAGLGSKPQPALALGFARDRHSPPPSFCGSHTADGGHRCVIPRVCHPMSPQSLACGGQAGSTCRVGQTLSCSLRVLRCVCSPLCLCGLWFKCAAQSWEVLPLAVQHIRESWVDVVADAPGAHRCPHP